jgi:shikimate kinase
VKSPEPHIILIGFKHVGKSAIGRTLALHIHKKNSDLDEVIEHIYSHQYQDKLTCREIVQHKGEAFFRTLEQAALAQALQNEPCIISTGGGTPMRAENCALMAPHCVVHITAEPKQVFDRIMRKGRPAFFPKTEDPWLTFQRLWQEREKVYRRIATFSVENNHSVTTTVTHLLKKYYELRHH